MGGYAGERIEDQNMATIDRLFLWYGTKSRDRPDLVWTTVVKMGMSERIFGTLLGRSCVVSESKDDYKTRKVNDYTYEQGLIRVGENYSNAYRAYT